MKTNSRQGPLKKLIFVLKYLWVVAVVIFAFIFINEHKDDYSQALQNISLQYIFFSLSLILLTKFLLGLHFHFSVQLSGRNLATMDSHKIYNLSQMGKYIPGSIWQFIGKAGMLKSRDFKPKDISFIILAETIFLLVFAALIGLTYIYKGAVVLDISFPVLAIIISATLTSGIAIAWIFKNKLKLLISGLFKKKSKLLMIAFNQICIWLIFGLSLLVLSGEIQSLDQWFIFSSVYAFSFFISFLVPFAPAGIGIREGMIFYGFQLFGMDSEFASFIALSHRLIYFLAELILALFFSLINKTQTQELDSV